MRMTFPRSLILVLVLLLTACSGLGFDAPTLTPPPATATPPQTPTIAWFPATATPTHQVFPTQLPPPDMLVGVGNVIATDDFSDPSTWNTAISDNGSATINNKFMTIAVRPGVYMLSLQQTLVESNFYAEITAQPSLCKGEDSYGMLVRANAVTYYRYALACDGTARVERISGSRRYPLQAPVPSGDAPPGAPGKVRIGVWAVGPEMRFFLNGRYQFSVTDLNLASGTIGVFALSTGNTPVTVTFSDLVIKSVSYIPEDSASD